jgi:hypothetical protein
MLKYIFSIVLLFPFLGFAQSEQVLHIRKVYQQVNEEFVAETSLPTRTELNINTMEAGIGLQACQLKFFHEIGSMNEGNKLSVKMIQVKYNVGAPEIYHEFLFDNNQLIFVFIKDDAMCSEKRYYFANNQLIHYIQQDCQGKNKTEETKFTPQQLEVAQKHQAKSQTYLTMFEAIQEFKDKNW